MLVSLKEYIERAYSEDSRPDRRTVLLAFCNGTLPTGALVRIGRRYFVDLRMINERRIAALMKMVLNDEK